MIVQSNASNEYKYLPGDFVKEVYPEYATPEVMHTYLSELQIVELKQYLVCYRCKKACAGGCEQI